jgi:hypothetical protein|tara:strand:- start:41 stop:559 length:519 start_codon:yes stop_codon:yes gene_type:complete
MNYDELKQKAEEMGVDLDWAVNCRKRYIAHVIRLVKEEMQYCNVRINTFVQRLAGSKDIDREICLNLINDYKQEKKELRRIFVFSRKTTSNNSGVTSEMREEARVYPIAELLPHPVKRNMTNCFNHEDKHPSMGIKNNMVHCFVCDKTWDTIAVVMEVKGLSFTEAVRYLTQ